MGELGRCFSPRAAISSLPCCAHTSWEDAFDSFGCFLSRGWDEVLPASRTRPEAENIAIKNSNDSMYGLLRNDNVQPVSPAKDLKTLPHMKESPSP